MVAFRSFTPLALFTALIHLLLLSTIHAAPSSLHARQLHLRDANHFHLSSNLLPRDASPSPSHTHSYAKRELKYILRETNNGTIQALDVTTRASIAQGPATDGAGTGFDAAAVIWIGWSFVVGLPILGAGMRYGRISSGVGVGTIAALLAWTSIINSLSATPLSSITITLITLGFFITGVALGCLSWGMHIGAVLLCVSGGLSLGVRLCITKTGLLVGAALEEAKTHTIAMGERGSVVVRTRESYVGNWVIVGLFGAAMGAAVFWSRTRRGALAASCASVGTFFTFLALDLCVNQQNGMSRGLRLLFDRNPAHVADLFVKGYVAPGSTQAFLAISFALTPIAAYLQLRFVATPDFLPRPRSFYDPTIGDLDPDDKSMIDVQANVHGGPMHVRGADTQQGQGPAAVGYGYAGYAPSQGQQGFRAPPLGVSSSTLEASSSSLGVDEKKGIVKVEEKDKAKVDVKNKLTKLSAWMKRS